MTVAAADDFMELADRPISQGLQTQPLLAHALFMIMCILLLLMVLVVACSLLQIVCIHLELCL